MKKYGLKIGNIGIEFPSIQDRDKAIAMFIKGSDVVISDTGIRYVEGAGSFSVYDRDTSEQVTNCEICKGVFFIDTCNKKLYPMKYSYSDNYQENDGYICDACYAQKLKLKEIFDAKKLLEDNED